MPEKTAGRSLLILLMIVPSIIPAQDFTNHNWYFGNSPENIVFNKSDNQPNLINVPGFPAFSTAGSAVATDPVSGDLLFYTDGSNIYDAANQLMLNNIGLNSSATGNQRVVVSNVPGDMGKYYVFSNTGTFAAPGSIFYTVVDMAQFGNSVFPNPALGAVDPANRNMPTPLNNTSEAMIVVHKQDSSGFWLISKRNGDNNLYDILDISSGIGNITLSSSPAVGNNLAGANLSYNDAVGFIAVSPQNENRNIQILAFDNSNGSLTFNSDVLNSGYNNTSGQAIYDTEWSINGRYLYFSRTGGGGFNGDVRQYDLQNTSITLASVLPAAITNSYGLKMGPDSAIYHLYASGSNLFLGRINDPDSVAANTNYETLPFGATNFDSRQLPATLPPHQIQVTASFMTEGLCANEPTIFFPDINPPADAIVWNLGDGNFSTEISPVHVYDGTASPYTVEMIYRVNGQIDTVSQTLNIQPFDIQITLVADTVACRDEFPPPRGTSTPTQFSVTAQIAGSTTPESIVWSNGDTGPTLTPDSAGFYYVIATAGGCSVSASVRVQEYGLLDQSSNVWYFGQNAGIDFNPLPDNPPVALNDGLMVANEGCTAISDQNGEILFYTDGSSVYVADNAGVHTQIATGIGGNPEAAQSVLATQFPNDETLWYIFTNEAVDQGDTYTTRYSVFDIKLNNGLGGIVKSGVPLFTKSTERMSFVNGWLLIHEFGNNTFRAYPITMNGIGNPVLSSIGRSHDANNILNGMGYMKFSQDGQRLAVTLSNSINENYLELFNFDSGTGMLTNYTPIDLTADGATGQAYGVEFSPGGGKVYVSIRSPGSSEIFEYRSDTLSKVSFLGPLGGTSSPFSDDFGAIQFAPDGQIYVAINGSTQLGAILPNEDSLTSSGFNQAGFALAGGTSSRLGLPNFIQFQGSQTGLASLNISPNGCINTVFNLSATPTSIIDEFQWSVLDPTNMLVFTSTQQADTFTPVNSGIYKISLQVTNRCSLDTLLTQDVEIFDNPPTPENPPVAVICDDGGVTLTALSVPDPTFTYLWNTGDTTRQVVADRPGFFDVTITNQAGCTSFMSTFVNDARPQVDLGPDLTTCLNNFVPDLNAQVLNASYAWTVNGGNPSSNQTRTVDTSVPGTFEYVVTVTEPAPFLCSTSDTVVITVLPEPVIVATLTDSPGCNQNMGQIDLEITSTGSYTYVINGPSSSQQINIPGPTAGPINIPNLMVGTYSIQVTDEVSNCTFVQTGLIADQGAPFTVDNPVVNLGCGTITLDINLSGTPALPVNYTLTNINDNTTFMGSSAINPFPTLGIPPGDYTIDITDNATCLASNGPFNVSESQQAELSVQFDNCTDPATLTATTNLSNPAFQWMGNNIIGSTVTNPITIGLASGTYSVTVQDVDGILCDSTVSIAVNPVQIQTVTIQSTGVSCDGQINLNASVSPAGNYNFLWLQDGNNFSTGQNIVITQSGNYEVQVTNQQTGCFVSTNQDFEVFQPVTVSVSSTPPCDDGTPITITANASGPPGLTYSWFRNNSVITGETQNFINVTQDGTYRADVETPDGCIASDFLDLVIFPVNESELPGSVVICPDDPDPLISQAILDPGGDFIDYQWTDESGTVISTNRFFTATFEAELTVQLTNLFGCVTTDVINIIEDCIPTVFGPNAFKPTGVNNEFFLFTKFLTDFEIFIYSKWGEIVFYSSDKDFRWNGSFEGETLPAGTYAYIVRFKSEFRPEDGIQEKRSGVILLR